MQKNPGDIMNICLDDVTYIEFKILELYNFLKNNENFITLGKKLYIHKINKNMKKSQVTL